MLGFVRNAKLGYMEDVLLTQRRLVHRLRGRTASASACPEEDEGLDGRIQGRVPLAVCVSCIRKLQERFLFAHYREALSAAVQAKELLWTSICSWERCEHSYVLALTLAALHAQASPGEREEYLRALRTEVERHRTWADNCPENFQNRHALVSAELARVEGRELEAERLYEEAIRSAHENGFVQNEALAYELGASSYRARGRDLIADGYLREARACYQRWGAEGKVEQLERLFPQLVERQVLGPSATLAVRSEELDLLSVVKASQRISGEIEIETLAGTLLQVVLEQGGARRGCLVLQRDGALFFEAEASMEEEGVVTRLLPSLAVESSPLAPVTVLHYTRLSRRPVIIEDVAAGAGKFASDPYFSRHKTRSVLCLPILRQGELVGLLYLENRFIAAGFTPDRLTALSLLAAQAAISVENALLLAREREARVTAEEARRAAEQARAAIEEAERRSAFLAEAGVILSESLDYEQTLTRLGDLCVKSLADWCVLDLVQGNELRRLAGACADPAKQPLLRQLRERYPARWNSPHPAAGVLRDGEPLWVPAFTDDLLRSMCEDEEHMELLRALGTCSAVVVPLVARGQTLGVLSLTSGTPGRYGRADLELAQEVAHRAAIAIDNAQLYRETQRAVRLRDEFLLVASHELRTPMTPLTMSLKALQRWERSGQRALPAAISESVELAARQGTRLNRLVGELLDVSRIESGWPQLDLSEVELESIVREVTERFEPELVRARCPVSIRCDGPVVGRWDASRLDQVVTNLLSNAIKFGADRPIEIYCRQKGDMALLAVRDHGMGIELADQARIFERFERAVSVKHYGGLGLGLYISRRIVEAHGGSIRLESRPGAGATFTVELPCAGPGEAASRAGE
jgi:signal transduction histidine kinase/tetratricopeptide (TPR) repeat protein